MPRPHQSQLRVYGTLTVRAKPLLAPNPRGRMPFGFELQHIIRQHATLMVHYRSQHGKRIHHLELGVRQPYSKSMYKRLSEQVQSLVNPQRSDTFIKRFREAVRTGQIKAINLPSERFTMPKQYTRRGKTGTYQKDTKEMLFEVTPEFEAWFEEQNKDLAVSRQGGQVKVTEETLAAGLVDFGALARETQAKMQASYEKGQLLGKSRGAKSKPGGAKSKPAARSRTRKAGA